MTVATLVSSMAVLMVAGSEIQLVVSMAVQMDEMKAMSMVDLTVEQRAASWGFLTVVLTVVSRV